MALQLRWAGEDDLDRVALARMQCYAHAGKDLDRFRDGIRADPRAGAGDFLLAERDGHPVGTATSLSFTMWVRGGAIPCQGVAFVGTIKTHRRRQGETAGVATQVMRETLRRARERGQAVSALMPFRASFYEHFGYGLVERRNEWTVPLDVLPPCDFAGVRFYRPDDLDALLRFGQQVIERGQGDIERSAPGWPFTIERAESAGFVLVDRPRDDGPIHGVMTVEHFTAATRDHLRVTQHMWADAAALRRQLGFLSSLRDQYAAALLTLPVDLPVNYLLRETQVPHRPVNHATAELRQHTRMQVRVLDHARLLHAVQWPAGISGRAIVSVGECEGTESRFAVDVSDERAQVAPTNASPTFACPDRIWAAIAFGELPASRAVQLGLAQTHDPGACRLLDALSVGPAPFCHESF